MNDVLQVLASGIRSVSNPDVHVVTGERLSDDIVWSSSTDPSIGHADVLDPNGIAGVNVGTPASGKLSYFMDGKEHSRLVLYYASTVPVVYGCVAAAVRFRDDDRKMRGCGSDLEAFNESLYFSHAHLSPQYLGIGAEMTVNTATQQDIDEPHPQRLLQSAAKRVGNQRESLERGLISKWLTKHSGADTWLLIDGPLNGDFDKYREPNVVGVIKSHMRQYLSQNDQRIILDLSVGERSGVFVPDPEQRRNRPKVLSWYLRLWPNNNQDMYFGLVRVELPFKSDWTHTQIDDVSRWILAERTPLSLPDSRWDRMIYPIRHCEQYLASKMPTKTLLMAQTAALQNALKSASKALSEMGN